MPVELPDAVYRISFGAGALLDHGGIVVRRGGVAGIGHDTGDYKGSATFDASSQQMLLDMSARIPTAHPISVGLKAGPAGSTVHFIATGAPPDPDATYTIDLAGHRGKMTLQRFCLLDEKPAASDTPAHPDAFPDGIYRMASAGVGYLTKTFIVMNGGQLVGLGEMGGQYRGAYTFDPIRKLTEFKGKAKLPPGAPLIVGGSVGSDWLTVSLASETKFNNGRTRLSFSLAGRSIDAELTFHKPLPQ